MVFTNFMTDIDYSQGPLREGIFNRLVLGKSGSSFKIIPRNNMVLFHDCSMGSLNGHHRENCSLPF